MLSTILNWIRQAARQAILDGVADAVDDLRGDGITQGPDLHTRLAAIAPAPLTLPEPAPTPDVAETPKPLNGRRKAMA